jgi:exonuclease SbcC
MVAEREELLSSSQVKKDELSGLEKNLATFTKVQRKWQEENELLNQLETERKLLAQESTQLKLQAAEVSSLEIERTNVTANLVDANVAVDGAKEASVRLSEYFQRSAVAQADLDVLVSEQQRLRANMDKLRDRLDRLKAETGGICPLCGQSLTEDHRKSVLIELEADGKGDADQYRNNQATIKELKSELIDLKEKVSQKDRLEREQKAQQQRLATTEAQLKEINRRVENWQKDGANRLSQLEEQLADQRSLIDQRKIVQDLKVKLEQKERIEQEYQICQREVLVSETRLEEIIRTVNEWEGDGEIDGLAAELAVISKKLADENIDPTAQAALDELRKKSDEINYNASEHHLATQTRDELAGAELDYQDLKQAEAAVKPLEDSLADLTVQIKNQESFITEQDAQFSEASAKLDAFDADELDLVAIQDETFRLREEKIAAARMVATAQQNISVLDALEKQRRDNVAMQEESRQRIRRLKMLEKACGRDGVQALLIEKALPEIEENANELLVRLSNGEMTVDFDTVRQLKSSDRTVETLDIRIIDNVGERPYENYSGGEQFRVNFAIRLALSRILTRRAGARLQTLVIDEGFGSQDPDGRQKLIEAINTIQDDFKRILVITHIDEMRDAFPNRIEVEKGPAGSQITVV